MSGKSGVRLNWGGLDRAMQGAARALDEKGRKALLAEVGETLISSTQERFDEGKDPQGKAWEVSGRAWERGLAVKGRKATEKRKGKRGRRETGNFGKTLLDKGRLVRSIDKAVTTNAVMVGSNLEYARIHQKGGKAGRGRKVTIPQREYLGISDDDREEIAAIMADFLKNGFLGE